MWSASSLKFKITWNFAQLNPGILTLLEHFEDSKFDVFPNVAKNMREHLEEKTGTERLYLNVSY